MRRRDFNRGCATSIVAVVSQRLLAADEPTDKKEWGNLTATFLYDGVPPERRRLRVDKDEQLYKDPILDPSLIVDRKSKRLANVVVWLHAPADRELSIHASYVDSAKEEVVLDAVNGNLWPHVTLLWTPQTLVIKNSEPVGHNRAFNARLNQIFCPLLPASGSQKFNFDKSETLPISASCSIHPWESGYLLIRDNPYMNVSDQAGKLTIKNLPVGKHTFFVWHENAGFIKHVKRAGKVEPWKKGRLTVDIKPGDNELGEILCKPEQA